MRLRSTTKNKGDDQGEPPADQDPIAPSPLTFRTKPRIVLKYSKPTGVQKRAATSNKGAKGKQPAATTLIAKAKKTATNGIAPEDLVLAAARLGDDTDDESPAEENSTITLGKTTRQMIAEEIKKVADPLDFGASSSLPESAAVIAQFLFNAPHQRERTEAMWMAKAMEKVGSKSLTAILGAGIGEEVKAALLETIETQVAIKAKEIAKDAKAIVKYLGGRTKQ